MALNQKIEDKRIICNIHTRPPQSMGNMLIHRCFATSAKENTNEINQGEEPKPLELCPENCYDKRENIIWSIRIQT